MKYSEPLFRPPAEANSLIFQIAYGCPWNGCQFCMMYKGVRYSQRSMADISAEIADAANHYPKTRRIFLADGDVMALSFEDLRSILIQLNNSFSQLARVNIYANASSILAKSTGELCELSKLKLNTLYLGLESGDDEVLSLISKNDNAENMVNAVEIAQENGLKCSVMALLGVAGRALSAKHAEKTAAVLNQMQPRLLSILRFIEVSGTRMFDGYEALSEYEAVEELYNMVNGLDLKRTVFTANHASNPIPLKGRFPQDKEKLLNQIAMILKSNSLDIEGQGRVPLYL